MPADLLEAVLAQKGSHDFGSSSLCQHIALEAIRDGSYGRHVEMIRREYRRKRDAMLGALEKQFEDGKAPGVRWTRPEGGLYVWVTLPEKVDASGGSELFKQSVERGVLYVPGDICFQPDEFGRTPRNHLRLSFGQVAYEQIGPGVARLAEAVREMMEAGKNAAPAATAGEGRR
jgi:2-aminoadipate transaminase